MAMKGPEPLCVEVFDRLDVELEEGVLLRFLGYPEGAEARPVVAEGVARALEETRGRLRPRGTYALYPVLAQTPRTLTLGPDAEFTGDIGGFLRAAGRVAVFVCTAGPEMMAMIDAAWDAGDALRGMILDALGSMGADRAAEKLAERLRGKLGPGEALTPSYSPGYCGMDIEQQRLIFRLVDAGAVGVELLPSCLMKPLKSVSGLIGLGPADEVVTAGSPCELCPLENCRMRR